MNEQAWWVIAIVAVVTSGVIGFFIGRAGGAGRGRVDELEEALAREKAALEAYKEKVDAHFDKTAGLFVSMAGSYKSLFEHLANGYEALAPGGARGVFKERIETMLAAPAKANDEAAAETVGPAAVVAAATGAIVTGPEPEPVAGATDGATDGATHGAAQEATADEGAAALQAESSRDDAGEGVGFAAAEPAKPTGHAG